MIMFHSIRKNDIFISYSVRDTKFVQKLDATIRKRGRDPWIDWEDLTSVYPNSDPSQCIEAGIKDAELFVFVISPDSITSEKNIKELELAKTYSKHIVPILWREPDRSKELPAALSEREWIPVQGDDVIAIDRVTSEILHHDTYARLLIRAELWDKAERSEDLLLSGRDLATVKRQLESLDLQSENLKLKALQQEYLETSSKVEAERPKPRPEIFVSYSRRDKAFVADLLKKLKEQQEDGLAFWVDWENIPVASDWQQEIYEGIEASHTFLFILSPCSAISEFCCDEIAHAVVHGKRIIPLLFPQNLLPQDFADLEQKDREILAKYRTLPDKDYLKELFEDVDPLVVKKIDEKLTAIPESLRKVEHKNISVRRRQAFLFRQSALSSNNVQELLEVINTDLEAAKYHTDLDNRVSKWIKSGRDSEYLLSGKELDAAKQFLASCEARKFKRITLTNLQKSYIEISRKARRQKRIRIATISAVPIIGTLLLFTGLIGAERGRIGEMVSSLENVEELDALVTALRAGSRLQGLGGTFNLKKSNLEVRVITALQQEIYSSRERNRLTDPWLMRVSNVNYSPDNQFVVAASEGGISVWGQNDRLICQLPTDKPSLSIAFDPAVAVKTKALQAEKGDEFSHQTSYQIFATAGDEGTVQLWQIVSSPGDADRPASKDCDFGMVRSLNTLPEAEGQPRTEGHSINSLAFSPNGLILAAARNDGTVSLWTSQAAGNVDDWQSQPPLTLRHSDKGRVNSISFSPNGKILATAGEDGTVKLWSSEQMGLRAENSSQQPKILQHGNKPVLSVSFSANSELVASGGEDGAVKLWKADGKQIPLGGKHEGIVSRITFSADYNNERFLASAGEDDSVRLWEISTNINTNITSGKSIHVLRGHQGDVYRVAFHKDNQTLITASADDTIKLWAWREGKLLESLEGHRGEVVGIDISANGRELASASADRSIKLWDLQNRIQTLPHNNRVNDVAFYPYPNVRSRSANNVIASSGNQSVKVWQQDGKLLSKEEAKGVDNSLMPNGEVLSLSFSPNGQWLISGGELTENGNGEIGFWKWNQQTQTLKNLSLTSKLGVISEISFSPTDGVIATAHLNGLIRLWKIENDKLTSIHDWQPGMQVNSVSFSSDGKYLVSAGIVPQKVDNDERTRIKIWKLKGDPSDFTKFGVDEVASWQAKQGTNIFSVSFSDDRNPEIASAGADGSIKLWSLEGEPLKMLKDQGRPPHRGEVYSVTFSPNGMLLASAGEDGTIKLWTAHGDLITTLKRHRRSVKSISFSRDSKMLASAGQDGNVYLWELPDFTSTNILNNLLTQGCTLAGDFIQSKPQENREEVAKLDKICDRHLKTNWFTRLFGKPERRESEPERAVPDNK